MVSEFPVSLHFFFFFLPLENEHDLTKEEKLWETYSALCNKIHTHCRECFSRSVLND